MHRLSVKASYTNNALTVCLLSVLLFFVYGCHQGSAVQNGGAAAAENASAQDTEAFPCKWGSNPMFRDGYVFQYKIETVEDDTIFAKDNKDNDNAGNAQETSRSEENNSSEASELLPKWWRDDEEELRDSPVITKAEMQCKVKLTRAESFFCASSITCTSNSEEIGRITEQLPAGMWYIDDNGVYYMSEPGSSFQKQPEPGNCGELNHFQCKPETLAYEYIDFAGRLPRFATTEKDGFLSLSKDGDDSTKSATLIHNGNVWQSIRTVMQKSGDNKLEVSVSAEMDETRGITRYSSDVFDVRSKINSHTLIELQ